MRSIPPLLVLALGLAVPALGAQDVGKNPMYLSWSGYEVGTRAVQETETTARGFRSVTTSTYTLLELDEAKAVVEIQTTTVQGDLVEENDPYTFTYKAALPGGVKSVSVSKPPSAIATGEETIEAAGRIFDARWYDSKGRTEAGETAIRTWVSLDAPGLIIKSVTESKISDKTMIIRLVKIETPSKTG